MLGNAFADNIVTVVSFVGVVVAVDLLERDVKVVDVMRTGPVQALRRVIEAGFVEDVADVVDLKFSRRRF